MQNKVTAFLESQRREADWTAFLIPLLREMRSALDEESIRQLMILAGSQAGQTQALPPCESIEELETQMNMHLSRLGWGVVSLSEHENRLEICHECPPREMQEEGTFANVLQGLYQQWLRAAGASDDLQVHHIQDAPAGTFLYHLAG